VKLLLVESEVSALPFTRELLVGLGDAIVTTAVTSEEAWSLDGDADLVVIARHAWTGEDTDLCQRVLLSRSSPPILAISGPCEARERTAALLAGADEFLSIPFDIGELVARALALLRRASTHPRPARIGPLSVDFWRRHVFVDGGPVALTLREYDLLATLIGRVGEVVTRRELAERLRPTATVGDSNVVDVHMSRIRDKLGPHAAQIETVRGIGYRLRSS
jgi:DNA-binding response OmpR family regulator